MRLLGQQRSLQSCRCALRPPGPRCSPTDALCIWDLDSLRLSAGGGEKKDVYLATLASLEVRS